MTRIAALFSVSLKFLALAAFALCFMLPAARPATANPLYASIVIDAATGQVISERHADKILHPASLTKIMTLYMMFDAMKTGRLHPHQQLPVSQHAASMVPSKLGLAPGTTIRADHAMAALITRSANDVAVVVAEAIGGTEENFGRMMTRKARTLGLRHTVFKNASGLHHPEQVSTARDMAILARSLMYYHPEYYQYFSMREFTYQGTTHRNHNHLMRSYDGMDGIKTGYIRASGFNLVSSAVRDGRRLIGVVFGGRSTQTRNNHMAMLLDNGFAQAERLRLAQFHKTPPLPARKPVQAKIEVAAAGTAVQNNFGAQDREKSGGFDMMGLIIGEGDIDMADRDTLKQSVAAIAATDAGLRPDGSNPVWQIQIGAFSSADAARSALNTTISALTPETRQNAIPRILPLQTQRGTIYRARIAGFTRDGALKTCETMNNCIIVAAR
ncbi:MAG: D-alanyl-D-alanine carboxypeptidase [Micavibrio sp.]|nr:MAG: D-alanyl-D-alanine carboxypeptidase [Micavibrio sp.]